MCQLDAPRPSDGVLRAYISVVHEDEGIIGVGRCYKCYAHSQPLGTKVSRGDRGWLLYRRRFEVVTIGMCGSSGVRLDSRKTMHHSTERG